MLYVSSRFHTLLSTPEIEELYYLTRARAAVHLGTPGMYVV